VTDAFWVEDDEAHMTGSIRAGGLASGLDTDSIISSIVTLQSASIDKLNPIRATARRLACMYSDKSM
jgi:hypothetical protein